jgi:ATP-dependent DNA helicase RecG
MDIHKLKQLLKQEEGPKLDFKAALSLNTESEKKELTKDVIAIANSRGGRGYIVFGIEDKTKKILGIDQCTFMEEQIQQIIYNRCDPPVPVSVDFFHIEDKCIAVLSVYRSNHKPHQMLQNGAFYLRRGSTTDTARRGEIANLLQENGLMTYETVILKNIDTDELDQKLIRQYFANLNVIAENPSEVLLEAM